MASNNLIWPQVTSDSLNNITCPYMTLISSNDVRQPQMNYNSLNWLFYIEKHRFFMKWRIFQLFTTCTTLENRTRRFIVDSRVGAVRWYEKKIGEKRSATKSQTKLFCEHPHQGQWDKAWIHFAIGPHENLPQNNCGKSKLGVLKVNSKTSGKLYVLYKVDGGDVMNMVKRRRIII